MTTGPGEPVLAPSAKGWRGSMGRPVHPRLRLRRSTLLIALAFVGFGALYLNVPHAPKLVKASGYILTPDTTTTAPAHPSTTTTAPSPTTTPSGSVTTTTTSGTAATGSTVPGSTSTTTKGSSSTSTTSSGSPSTTTGVPSGSTTTTTLAGG